MLETNEMRAIAASCVAISKMNNTLQKKLNNVTE